MVTTFPRWKSGVSHNCCKTWYASAEGIVSIMSHENKYDRRLPVNPTKVIIVWVLEKIRILKLETSTTNP